MAIDAKFLKSIPRLRKKLISGEITPAMLYEQREDFERFAQQVIRDDRDHAQMNSDIKKVIADFLMICLDVYTYSENGSVLITDYTYDQVMNIWCKETGKERMAFADYMTSSALWPFVKHEAPFMVGTIDRKIYDLDTLEIYLDQYYRDGYERLLYAPKFDGVSSAVTFRNGVIERAVTRNNGYEGQDITEVIKRMNRKKKIFDKNRMPDGYYKCELVMTTKDFDELREIKPYANRRSAASACISTPNNLPYAEYLTAIPLAYVNFEGTKMTYLAAQYAEGLVKNPSDFSIGNVYDNIETILRHIRTSEYPVRTDGVVIFPVFTTHDAPNTTDLMANALAFKVNTQEAISKAKEVFVSVGRMGLAEPMLRVEPVEVNETIVTKAALGSLDQFSSMNIHKDEDVIVFAAGDVIPQIKMPEMRNYPKGAERLQIDLRCPYCGKKLRYKNEKEKDVWCLNPKCPRVLSGRIANFLEKLDVAEGYRDRTFMTLVEAKIVYTIEDLFTLHKYYQRVVDALHSTYDADMLLKGLKELKDKIFEVSQVLGAVGIDGVGQKTCQVIFGDVTLDELLDLKKSQLIIRLLAIPKIGMEKATVIGNWINENRDFIETLQQNMHIVDDSIVWAQVCFTGFRNKEYANILKKLGFPTTDKVNNKCVACVYAGDATTSNARTALDKDIPLVHVGQLDGLVDVLTEEANRLKKDNTIFSRANIMRTIQVKVCNANPIVPNSK